MSTSGDALRPRHVCSALLAALNAAEGRSRARKRDQTPDAIGLALRRDLLEHAVADDPEPEAFEQWLLERVERSKTSGAERAMARTVLEEWRLANRMKSFAVWLDHGAPSQDATNLAALTLTKRVRVLIVGCGFGGLACARALQRAPVDVMVIDRTNHHLFQPLLYQVATAGLAGPDIAAPIRHLLRKQRNATVLLGEVGTVDTAHQQVSLTDGQQLTYDHLVLAAGTSTGYFGHSDWAVHAPGLKTLQDAQEIRRRILMAFESAEKEEVSAQRTAWLNFVVIGGGPTGVEMAGNLAEIARQTLPGEFRRIDPASSRVILLEGGPRLLPSMPEALSESAKQQLEALGVEVRLGTRVIGMDAQGVDVVPSDGSADRINSRCVIWAAGVVAGPVARALAHATGLTLDRSGRLPVAPDLSLPGHPEIWVIGDLAAAQSHRKGHAPCAVPGVAAAAKQMGRLAGRNILRRLRGQATSAFCYRDWGTLATIGRNSAVVDLRTPFGPLRFKGRPAWLFWVFAHLWFLIGFRNRVAVLTQWAWAYWTLQRYARVVLDASSVESPVTRPSGKGGGEGG